MKAIDYKTYRNIEWHMHNLPRLIKSLQSCREDILLGSAGTDYNTPKGHSKYPDSTAIKACKLADGTKSMQLYAKWIDAIDKTKTYFEGEQEANVLSLFYLQKERIMDVATSIGVDRRTVSRMRDNLVYRCAMYAAAGGLIDLET